MDIGVRVLRGSRETLACCGVQQPQYYKVQITSAADEPPFEVAIAIETLDDEPAPEVVPCGPDWRRTTELHRLSIVDLWHDNDKDDANVPRVLQWALLRCMYDKVDDGLIRALLADPRLPPVRSRCRRKRSATAATPCFILLGQ